MALSAVSKIKPYMVAAGNHEANCINGGYKNYTESICPVGQTNFTQFINRFGLTMPTVPGSQVSFAAHGRRTSSKPSGVVRRATPASLAKPPFWYSFDYGLVHILMFDTETDLGVGLIGPDQVGGSQGDFDGPFGSFADQQIDFIVADLASVDRYQTPWVVVAGHRPWYVSDSSPCLVCQQAFEKLFIKYGVDLAVFGHVHNQELIVPIALNVTDPKGWNNPSAPAYIVNGAAGHFEGIDALLSPNPPYVQWATDAVYGYTKLLFKSRTELEIQFINSQSGGTLLHSQVLTKAHTKRFYP